MAELTGELEVWQSNRLVEAAQTLTLNEKRLVIAAAALHDPRKPLPPRGTVTLHADDFADVFGLSDSHQVYEALKDAAGRLYNRTIRTIYTARGKPAERHVRWVWMADYRKGEGTVTLGFSPGVAPYLTLLHTEFTRYKLKQIGNIGSFYGLRLYELCAQFRKAGERSISLERLREMLDLGEKYQAIDNLRRRVLDGAIKEINRHTDLRVVVTPERKGRKVVGFRFDITQDVQMPLDLPGGGPEEHEERVLQGAAKSAAQEQEERVRGAPPHPAPGGAAPDRERIPTSSHPTTLR
jgi:plasmid replication initiation protein